MHFDLLVAEIGSTTTLINAFQFQNKELILIEQGFSETTVHLGDVTIGLNKAIDHLKEKLNVDDLTYNEMFATSSAAGGLKMTVHGLVYDMTVRAAKEAALGAGANIHFVTSGKMTDFDVMKIKKIKPNLILLAGGVDFGEKETAIYNARLLAESDINVPVIFAGNRACHEEIEYIFEKYNKTSLLTITENVYPQIDRLNIEPIRKIIHDRFEEHITESPGMSKIKEMVHHILPTPGAVMKASILLQESIGDLVTIDVGGATTDLHSVCETSLEIQSIMTSNEPFAKRTVEGDLGVFVNRYNVVDLITKEELVKKLNCTTLELETLLNHSSPIPTHPLQEQFVTELTKTCAITAFERHAGKIVTTYTTLGKKTYAEGKDLTNIKYIIGTGGALTRLSTKWKILNEIKNYTNNTSLLPKKDVQVLIDAHYIMASVGVLSMKYPKEALELLKKSIQGENGV